MKKYTSLGIDDLEWGRLRDATPDKTLERFILPSASGDVKKPLLALGRRISLSARPRKQIVWLRVLQSLRLSSYSHSYLCKFREGQAFGFCKSIGQTPSQHEISS